MRVREPAKRMYEMMQTDSIEIFLAFLCLLAGLPILLNPMVFAPASVLALLPFPLVFLWAVALVLGGLFDVAGIMFGNVYIRRAGLVMLAAGALIMAFTVVLLTGSTRLFAAGIYLVFSWATGSRYFRLGKLLKRKRKRWERTAREK